MKLEEALTNVSRVCSVYKGTLEEHKAIQLSLEMIRKRCFPVPMPEPQLQPVEVKEKTED